MSDTPIFKADSTSAYQALHNSRTRLWSVPAPNTFPELTEPEFGGARIFGRSVCAELNFKPRLCLTRKAKIFTLGSCFARNVEEALLRHGFEVLTRKAGFSYSHGYLNRYNSASMSQEIEFAIGERTFDPRSIASMGPDGYADLTSYGRFDTAEEALELRRQTTALFQSIREADFVIVTAGLSEVWYDKEFSYYTNIAPSRAALVYPDRFEFRLLSFQDNLDHLRRLIRSVRRIRPESQILMTVSPVPLNATFVDRDVLISNSYSKACLRAAVEQIQWEFTALDYFPSFEMVNLSDPSQVWESDRRHVRQEFVDRIMSNFASRYIAAS